MHVENEIRPVRVDARFIRTWMLALAATIATYLLVHLVLADLPVAYALSAVFWSLLAIGIYFSQARLGIRHTYSKYLIALGLLVGFFQVSCLVIAGFVDGFAQSPHNHGPLQVLRDLLVWVPPLIALELGRSFFLRPFANHGTVLMVALSTLLFTCLYIPLNDFAGISGREGIFAFLGGTILPMLSMNLLAAALVLVGGPLASMFYIGALLAYQWLAPVVPDLSWLMRAFIGTLAPVMGYWIIRLLYKPASEERAAGAQEQRKSSKLASWMVPSLMAVVLIWVSTGVLGFRPVSIVTGSMSPAIEAGDLVIVREASADAIGIGDIIQFQRGGSTTVHRVVEIREGNPKSFVTKGDANGSTDQPVKYDQVLGRVETRVPKVGWLPIYIKQFLGSIANRLS